MKKLTLVRILRWSYSIYSGLWWCSEI